MTNYCKLILIKFIENFNGKYFRELDAKYNKILGDKDLIAYILENSDYEQLVGYIQELEEYNKNH
jgi:hypothetical protein